MALTHFHMVTLCFLILTLTCTKAYTLLPPSSLEKHFLAKLGLQLLFVRSLKSIRQKGSFQPLAGTVTSPWRESLARPVTRAAESTNVKRLRRRADFNSNSDSASTPA